MVSFDVESLFTSIPLDEFIDLAITCIYQVNPALRKAPLTLNLFILRNSRDPFLKGVFYDQMDEVAMGSPLAPLANLFMGHLEKNWLDTYSSSQVLFYGRYQFMTPFVCLITRTEDALMLRL